MTQLCRVSQEEIAYDIATTNALREAIETAQDQLERVNDAAKAILSGHAIIDTRKLNVFIKEKNAYEYQRVPVNFSMKNVADLVAEEITQELCHELLRGTPAALFQMQKIIGEAAHQVAFDALNLSSDPFIDLNDLRETASEQA